jgi:hypothetical protein
LNDKAIDAQSHAIIRYALETNDPWLAELVRRADAGEDVFEQMQETNDDEKIAALTEIFCRAGDETTASLFVLMGKLQNSTEPKVIANTAKHLAFTRCGELNFCGMVDAQVAILERELLRE